MHIDFRTALWDTLTYIHVCIYVCVCEDWMQQAENDAKGLSDTRDFNSLYKRISVIEVLWKSIKMEPRYSTKYVVLKLAWGCCSSFQLSHQKNPCSWSLEKIHQQGVKIFNKTCSFEVSIGLLTLISIISSKESLLQKSHENPSTSSQDIYQNIQFWS